MCGEKKRPKCNLGIHLPFSDNNLAFYYSYGCIFVLRLGKMLPRLCHVANQTVNYDIRIGEEVLAQISDIY